jgi:hypothetical protein
MENCTFVFKKKSSYACWNIYKIFPEVTIFWSRMLRVEDEDVGKTYFIIYSIMLLDILQCTHIIYIILKIS